MKLKECMLPKDYENTDYEEEQRIQLRNDLSVKDRLELMHLYTNTMDLPFQKLED